ncbi:MAG: hypothetical protein ACHP84_04230 [Caulobacterales bacterium]
MPLAAYFIYLLITWDNVAKHPDAAVSGDEYYAQVVETRQAARTASIVHDAPPVVGGAASALSLTSAAQEDRQ